MQSAMYFGCLYFALLTAPFSTDAASYVDLTHVFDNKTMYWGTSTRFQHKLVWQGELNAEVPYYSAFDYAAAEHGGTHLDAPIHFAANRWSVDDIPTARLISPGAVVDISKKCARDRNAQLMVGDLLDWEKKNGQLEKDCILLVHTGWAKFWPDYKAYFGTDTKNQSLYRFPGIHRNTSQWLVDNRRVVGVGIDTPSLDYGKSTDFPSHQILAAQNIYGLENVANLDKLSATGTLIHALPMKIGDGSGAPVRILAQTDVTTGAGMSLVIPLWSMYLSSVGLAVLFC